MADDENKDAIDVAELRRQFTELVQIHMQDQAILLALLDYLSEQPAFDAARFKVLYEAQRTLVGSPEPPTGSTSRDAALQALLRAFEGRPH